MKLTKLWIVILCLIGSAGVVYAWHGDPPPASRINRIRAFNTVTRRNITTRIGYDDSTHSLMVYSLLVAADKAYDIGDGGYGLRYLYFGDGTAEVPTGPRWGDNLYRITHDGTDFDVNDDWTVGGIVNATGGFKDNGVAGVDGTYSIYNDGTSGNVTSITVSGGLITSVTTTP